MEIKKGTRLKNRYEITELLGEGGFGKTYKAIDHLLNRFVAIKCSDKSLAHEAKILKALDNVPNISHRYDYFTSDKKHFLVMKLINGVSLSKYRNDCGGKISLDLLTKILPYILTTLDQMHERGIIHRDISPGNFLIDDEKRLFLIDFGTATSIREGSLRNNIIFSHLGLDAPESARADQQGPWTDIYSLCVTIIYLLTGEGIPLVIDRQIYDPVPSILTRLSLSSKMQNALMNGLALDRSKRYKSIQAFAKAFYGKDISVSTMDESYSVHYHARTDIGKRNVNQDNFMVDTLFQYGGEDCEIKGYIDCAKDEIHIAAIADGVASSNHGELASKAAIQALTHFVENYRNDEGLNENLIEEFLNQLNEKIIILSKKIGMTATTISILMWKNDKYCIANIGDSPVYKLSDDHLYKLSEEHVLSNEKLQAGLNVTTQDFHTLTRYLGKTNTAGSEMAYIRNGVIKKGDIFLICSDGISGITTDAEKRKYMKKDGDRAIREFYKCAHKHPAMDNCTAIILKF